MKNNKDSKDFTIGLLIGEIIWLRLLGKFKEDDMLEKSTEDERNEYDRLTHEWEKSYDKKNDQESKEKFNEYRKYAHFLLRKYFSEIQEYNFPYCPYDNKKDFYKGLSSYLWNTDFCCYWFEEEDISINDMGWVTIKFKLNLELPK